MDELLKKYGSDKGVRLTSARIGCGVVRLP